MLKKRIIPCLDIKDGRTVKGVNFVDIRDAGDPVELATLYVEQGADELVFLDITATIEKRKTLVALVERIAKAIDIPFTVGGGIQSKEDVRSLLLAGADKISINSVTLHKPDIINEIASEFGSQCLVVAIDTNIINNEWMVVINGGRTPTKRLTIPWAKEVETRGAGEILLTSMAHDGTKNGYAVSLTKELCSKLTIPVIASGGAGEKAHFKAVFEESGADAALAASLFHFNELAIPELKEYLKTKNIAIR